MSHPLACSFCMRSTPIPLVLLSFPHNRSLSFYSPLLNWSILHLNQDISTTGKEREKRIWINLLHWWGYRHFAVFFKHSVKLYAGKKQKTEIFASVGRVWCSSGVSQPASVWSINISVWSAITISHLIRNKANMLTQTPSTVTTVGAREAAGLLIEA